METMEKMTEELLLLSYFKESIHSQRTFCILFKVEGENFLFIAGLGRIETIPVEITLYGLNYCKNWMGGRGSVKELAEKDQKKLQLFLHEFNLK